MKRIVYSLLLIVSISAVIISCKKSNPVVSNNQNQTTNSACPQAVVKDSIRYYDPFVLAMPQPFELDSLYISGDCLHVRIYSSGCSGSSWVLSAFDSEDETNGQRAISLWLDNQELCAAYIRKEYSFDIKGLRIAGRNSVTLNFMQFFPSSSIQYNY